MSVPPLGGLSHPEETAETRRQGLEPTQSDQRPAGESSRMEPERGIVNPQPGSPSPGSSPLVNLNRYATKKSLAESLLDMALFMSNAVQLKAVLDRALLNLNEVEKQWRLNQLNNAATALIFITVMINIFITAFGAHRIGLLAAGTPL
ncbi:ninjurin-2 isoform X2 [Bos indicus]|uniref:Ninjurin-2 isoform X2 n=2 Tax=Bos TaxID=9903 RepID=A0A6P5BVT1_BOSIN|nr:ninjurin-2 isoform X2 [Bos taurus]XP_027396800.1 ninjurin-2 isoform X2 [Bos indicus x Bos taurus]